MFKNTTYIKRLIYISFVGAAFAIYLIYSGTSKVEIADKVTKQIEAKFEVELLEKQTVNNKLSINDALARKNVKPMEGAIEKEELENLINERLSEPLTGKRFEPKTPESKRAELNKLDELYGSTKSAKVLLNSSGQPKAIYPKYTQSVVSHDAFIKESAELLDLNVPGSSLNVTRENQCIGNQCVSRYQRMAFGVPVLFSDMTLTTVDGKVISMTGALNQPNISKEMVENGDVLSEAELLEVAQSKLLGQWQITKSTYGIYESTGGAAPAYEVELRSGFRQYEMVIHAGTKTILNENNLLKHSTNASGLDLRGQRRQFKTIPYQGRNYLKDTRLPSGASTTVYDAFLAGLEGSYDNTGRPTYNFHEMELSTNTMVSSASTDSGWNPSAVSVVSHFETLFNYFSETHNYRFGESGAEAQPIKLIVDIEFETQANAFNAGTIMGFGKTSDTNYADSFEVVGHELGHGIVGDLAGLKGNGWPDTLNESFSDLFGVLASPQSGWGVGDDSPNAGVRSMSNPSSFGGAIHYRQYDPNVSIYTNAGISNYFFYLIAEGLTSDNLGVSIGRESLAQIAFGTLSSLNSRAEFNDVYNGMVAKAEELHGEGSTEVQAIERAAEVIGYKQIADNTETTVITQNAVFEANGQNITAFISPNYLTNTYDLYFQAFDSDNPLYDEQSVFLIANNVSNTAPAIATTLLNDIEVNLTFFKMADESINYIAIDSNSNISSEEFLSSSVGVNINQLQFSSDFRYLAYSYSEGAAQGVNSIGLYNLNNNTSLSLTPKSKSFTENVEGIPFESIDAIAFDPTNRRLAFDYLVCSSEDSEIIDGCAWQLGIYDIIDDSYEYPFAGLDREVSVGNPSFGKVNSNYIVFDLFVDSTNRSEVWILNTLDGTVNSIASSVTASVSVSNYTSRPSFTQDDSGLIFSVRQSDVAGDGYLFHQPLLNYNDNENDNGSYINAANRGVFPVAASINFIDARPSLILSATSIEFGAITSEAQTPICLSNNTNYPIKLYRVNNELESLNLSAIPNYISGGEQHCVPILIDVMEMQIGEFSQDVRFIHDGLNSPSIITVTGEKVPDNDGDGIPDAVDPDDDNDGTEDINDAFPFDATETSDTDNDGIGNNLDTDDDNDGFLDDEDAFPQDSAEHLDTDNDGIGNNEDLDDDNDSILDKFDIYPLISIGDLIDTDSDGAPDICESTCIALGMSEDPDKDGNGVNENIQDTDNDGVLDDDDQYPNISRGVYPDTDDDGIPDECDSSCISSGLSEDLDDDNDGVLDTNDAFPKLSLEIVDYLPLGEQILFGGRVDISHDGNTIMISNNDYSNDEIPGRGRVSLYEYKNENWVKKGSDLIGAFAYSRVGYSAALNANGDQISVLIYRSIENEINSSVIKNYKFVNNEWRTIGEPINISSAKYIDLSDDGSTLVVLKNPGFARYEFRDDTWQLVYESYSEIGEYIDISSDAEFLSIQRENDTGESKLYYWSDSTYQLQASDVSDRINKSGTYSINKDNSFIAISQQSGFNQQFQQFLYSNIASEGLYGAKAVSISPSGRVFAVGSNIIERPTDGTPVGSIIINKTISTGDVYSGSFRLEQIFGNESIILADRKRTIALDNYGKTIVASSFTSDRTIVLREIKESLSDSDLDGIPDNCDISCIRYGLSTDIDDDNDGFPDDQDAFPQDSSEYLDTDNDGIGNNLDTDDDNDSVLDSSDAYPLIAIGNLIDLDHDGSPDYCPDLSYSRTLNFNGTFGGTLVNGESFSFPYSAETWAGFANINNGIYPIYFPEGGRLSFVARNTSNLPEVTLRFRFERSPYPEVEPSFQIQSVTIVEGGIYSIDIPQQSPQNSFSSIIMYINERGGSIEIGDITLDVEMFDSCITYGMAADTDDDNDGVLDTADAYPLISIGSLTDTDSDGAPDSCDEACVALGMAADLDDDNDGVLDTADAYPLIAIGNLTDTDSDGAPDSCDEACVALGMAADLDDDNDGVLDTADAYPLIAIGNLTDTDSDGAPDSCDEACVALGMAADTDDDNDGVLDTADAYPLISIGSLTDTDSDGAPDSCDEACVALGMAADTDDDNDGVLDTADAYPLISIGSLTDTDSDGAPDSCDEACVALGMAADTDDDNDGVLDTADAYPLISIGSLTDTDSDGAPDSCDEACVALGMAADTDDDNDGVLDTADAYPLISIGSLTDTDSDGAPDSCDEACVALGMAADTDDDNDGVLDTADAYPLIAIGNLTDTDSDGAPDSCDEACVALGMAADTDDDNDGVLDTADAYPLISIGSLTDTDSDGAPDSCDEACVALGMAADTDDDNDGVLDTADAYPLIAIGNLTDTDSDGAPDSCDEACVALGMAADTDDDNDGVLDTADAYPLIAIGNLTDTDSDGAPDSCDEACVALGMAADLDDDNDGVLDTADAYPLISIGSLTDTDSDGAPDSCDEACVALGMAADLDDDNDGVLDTADAYPLIAIGNLTDTDSDGAPDSCDEACVALGMAADTDDDNDGLTDEQELANNLNPLDSSDANADLDGDGVSNAQEIANGTNVSLDDQPPVFTSDLSDLVIVSTGLQTPVTITNPDATDVGSAVTVTNDASSSYVVGEHVVTFTATDSAGNTARTTQTVKVIPYVYVSNDQAIKSGQTLTLKITLSDIALEYPVVVNLSASGTAPSSTYSISESVITIASGLTGTFDVDIAQEGLVAGDTIQLNIDDVDNAGLLSSGNNNVVLTLTEDNLPPTLNASVSQNDVISRTVDKQSPVTVYITVEDDTGLENITANYSGIPNLQTQEGSFNVTFNPSEMNEGAYKLTIELIESLPEGNHVVIENILINLKDDLPQLTTADSDGDGISDADEGLADTDNDGVPDYLDNTPQTNLQPLNDNVAQAQDSVLLALGETALETGQNSISVPIESVTQDSEYEIEEVFDFTLSGLGVGESYSLVIPLSEPIPADAVYRKLTTDGWVDFSEDSNNAVFSVISDDGCPGIDDESWVSSLVEGGTCIKLLIQDGSSNDTDGVANGTVEDPSGIAVRMTTPTTPTPTTPAPTNPQPGSNSSGGSISIYILLMMCLVIYNLSKLSARRAYSSLGMDNKIKL